MEEIFSIIKTAPYKIRAFFAIGFLTGMRTGEIVALKWEHIDFDKKIIKVRKARRGGIESDPKTNNSIRDVLILDPLMPYLFQDVQ